MGDNTLTFEIKEDKDTYDKIFNGRKNNPKGASEAAELLVDSFNWTDSQDGWKFWNRVHNRLIEISKVVGDKEPDKDDEGIQITIDGTDYIARAV